MKRVVGCVVIVAALVGLGLLIHAGTPPTASWRVRLGPMDPNEFHSLLTADGRILVLGPIGGGRRVLESRDARTGQLLMSVPIASRVPGLTLSPSGRWAFGLDGNSLCWIDTATGQERRAGPVQLTGFAGAHGFTPDERCFYTAPHQGRMLVIELPTGEVVGSAPCASGWVQAGGDRLFFPHGPAITIWDVGSRRAVGLLPWNHLFAVHPDGTRILVDTPDGDTLYDVTDPSRPKKLAAVAAAVPRTGVFRNGVAVVYPQRSPAPQPIHYLDAATGRTLWEFPFSGGVVRDIDVSPDGRLAPFTDGSLKGGTMSVLDLQQRRLAWTVPTQFHEFSPDSRHVLAFGTMDGKVDIHDAATGEQEATILIPPRLQGLRFEAGDSQLWLAALEGNTPPNWLSWLRPMREDQAGVLLGLEWPSRRVLLRVPDAGVKHFHVAEDGSYVITVHEDGLRRYDVPQPKPWAWSIGVPLALGAALLGLRSWWKLHRKKEPA
jgi:hypothetical protein